MAGFRSIAVAALIACAAVAPRLLLAQDTPVVEGEITAIDLSAGRFTIKHGPIANLGMSPAVDQFKVADGIMLNAVMPGAKIRFTADRIKGELMITAIKP
jgi:Cu/Ag efflux protein CusF